MKTPSTGGITPATLTLPDVTRDHIQGPADAPLKLLEYGDFECPYCGEAYPVVKAVQKKLGRRLCFAFRNFPLKNVHPHAEKAAEAAEAAAAQGRYWEMHDLLYEHQDALDDEDIARYASALDLDTPRLIAEVQNDTYAARVREDFRSGVRGGVNGTPTFFINGERYDGPPYLEELLAALMAEA